MGYIVGSHAEGVDHSVCGNPCSPDNACDACIEYWHRMRSEGYWEDGVGWTDKLWRETLRGRTK